MESQSLQVCLWPVLLLARLLNASTGFSVLHLRQNWKPACTSLSRARISLVGRLMGLVTLLARLNVINPGRSAPLSERVDCSQVVPPHPTPWSQPAHSS